MKTELIIGVSHPLKDGWGEVSRHRVGQAQGNDSGEEDQADDGELSDDDEEAENEEEEEEKDYI